MKGGFIMKPNKRQRIEQELISGKTVSEIERELGSSRTYIYKIKRQLDPFQKQNLINVTNLVKLVNVNTLTINGFKIECSDDLLIKIINGLRK